MLPGHSVVHLWDTEMVQKEAGVWHIKSDVNFFPTVNNMFHVNHLPNLDI